jgi:DnaJ-class molecular chaperone
MPPSMPFVPIQKHRSPGAGEKACPPCSGTGSIDTHVCKTCHGAGAVPDDWKPGDGPVKPGNKTTTKGSGQTKGPPTK